MRLQLSAAPSSSARPASALSAQRGAGPLQLEAEFAPACSQAARRRSVAAHFDLLQLAAPAAQAAAALLPSAPPCNRSSASVRSGRRCRRRVSGRASTQAGGNAFESAFSSSVCDCSVPSQLQRQRLGASGAPYDSWRSSTCASSGASPRGAQRPAGVGLLDLQRAELQRGGVEPALRAQAGQRPSICASAFSSPARRALLPGSSSSCAQRLQLLQRRQVGLDIPAVAAAVGRRVQLGVDAQLVAVGQQLQLAGGAPIGRRLQRDAAAQRHAGQAAGLQRQRALGRAGATAAAARGRRRAGSARSNIGGGVEAVRALAPRRVFAAGPPGQRVEVAQRGLAACGPAGLRRRPRVSRASTLARAPPDCASSSRSSMCSMFSRASQAQLDGLCLRRRGRGAGR